MHASTLVDILYILVTPTPDQDDIKRVGNNGNDDGGVITKQDPKTNEDVEYHDTQTLQRSNLVA